METMLWINIWEKSIIALFLLYGWSWITQGLMTVLENTATLWWKKLEDGSLIINYSVVKGLVKAIKLWNDQICCKLLLQSLIYKACYY